MVTALTDGLSYLSAQSLASLAALFWFTIVFEVPRYTLSFVAAALTGGPKTQSVGEVRTRPRVSVVVAGHNEADSIEKCVRSLLEQSRRPDEIVAVSDGSSDNMPAKLADMKRRGLVDQVHCTDLRAGKSAATNLGVRWSSGDIIINVDCDCSFDRHAFKHVIEPFGDPEIGAVSGNILARNPGASLVATFQAIEYMISISLGKQADALKEEVVCVSGAFGAFRREALDGVGGIDVGGGEDLDLTLRLREAGWRIGFRPDAICYTDVPDTLSGFIKQRFRWERDALRLRYRKHMDIMNPLTPRFSVRELFHELDFIFFHVIAAAMLPFYLLWLFATYGNLAFSILLAAQIGLLIFDGLAFVLAALKTPKADSLRLLPFMPGFSIFNGGFMRFVRLAAYLQEWIFNASDQDNYVPEKVRLVRRW